MRNKSLSTFLVVLAAVTWGSIGLFTRLLDAAGINTFQSVSIRATVTAIALAAILAFTNPKGFLVKLRDLPIFALCGVLSITINNTCYFYSIKYSGMSTAAVLLYTAPIFVTIMSLFVYREKLNHVKITALVMTFAGCILVSMTSGGEAGFSWLGIIFGLVSGLCYALYTMISKRLMTSYSPLTVAVYIFVFASISSFVTSNPVECVKAVVENGQVMNALGLGVISSAIPYFAYNAGLLNMAPSNAAIIATLEPVVAALIDIFFFKSYDSLLFKVLGMVFVVGAVIYLNLKSTHNTRRAKQ